MKIEEKCYILMSKINDEDVLYVGNNIHHYELTTNIKEVMKCANEITADIVRREFADGLYDFDIIPMKITYEY